MGTWHIHAPAALATRTPVAGFLLAQRGLSPNTVEAYGQDLESFFLYRRELAQGAAEESCPTPDEQEIFLSCLAARAAEHGAHPVRRLSALRAFCLCR